MKKIFLAILFMLIGVAPVFADDDALSMEAEYQQKIKEIKGEQTPVAAATVSQQPDAAQIAAAKARQEEILKKQEELRFIFSPKQDKQGNPVIPFIMPQGQTIQIPFVSHIPYFFSYVEIFYDGKMMVNETIDMVFTSKAYRKAFVRELDTSYIARDGSKRKLDIAVKSVIMNQTKLPFYVTNFDDKLQITVRPPEGGKFLDGVSTFYISYIVDGAVFFTPDFDDIFLNVIGNGFKVPVARAGMSVIFPKAPTVRAQGEMIGSDENPNIALKIDRDDEGNLAFAISDPLVPGDDFSVLLTIDNGTLVPPSLSDSISATIRKYAYITTSLLGLLIIFLRYVFSYREAKKQAATTGKKLNFTSYVSPALLYAFVKKKLDEKAFAYTVVGMASKGALSIEKTDTATVLKKISDKGLGCEEKVLYKSLFKDADTVELTLKDKLQKAFSSLKKATACGLLSAKIKANKEDLISTALLVFLLALMLGLQTYNYMLTTLFSVFLMMAAAFLVILFKYIKNALTLNVFSAKGGKVKLALYIVLALFIIFACVVEFILVWGFTNIGCAIVLFIVGLIVGRYPSYLREKRCEHKTFDINEYKNYLKTAFADIDNAEDALALYKKHMMSSLVVDTYSEFKNTLCEKFASVDVNSWYVAADKGDDALNTVVKAVAESVSKQA